MILVNLVSIRARDVVIGRHVQVAPGVTSEVLGVERDLGRPGCTLLHTTCDTLSVPSDGLVSVVEA